jgi:TolB-like protein
MVKESGASKTAVVAVLPFKNYSDDSETEYFSMGIADDLVMDLSRFNSLQVISPHSTRQIDSNENLQGVLIDNLRADFLVKGSFRRHAGRAKIGTQLISSGDGSIIWAERYNEELEEIHDVQDDMVQRIVNAIQKQINTSLLSASYQKKESKLEAYDHLLRGMSELKKGSVTSDEIARKHFQLALSIEPNLSRAYTGLSLSYFNEWSCNLWERWDDSQKGAHKYAQQAVALDPNDYVALSVLGRIYLYKGDYVKTEHYLRKSLRLNSNDSDTLIQIASCFVYLGYLKEAEKLYLKSIRLNPVNEEWYLTYGSFIYFELGEFEKSIDLALKADFDSVWVDLPAFIAAAYFRLGQLENMQKFWDIYLEQFPKKISCDKEAVPEKALEWSIEINPYNIRSQLVPFWEYMRREGRKETSDFSSPSPQSISSSNIFRKGTGLWEMSFEGESVFLPDVKGYHDLATLLSQPEMEFHCSELMGQTVRQDDSAFVMDEKARASYKKKIEELLSEIEEASEMSDSGRVALLQEEYEKLVDHLSSNLGLGGKTRKLDSPVEKARSAVTWRIRSAIKKIEAGHPQLSKHLTKSVKTGTFCSYSPENQVDWTF